jgi:hypothetical protein
MSEYPHISSLTLVLAQLDATAVRASDVTGEIVDALNGRPLSARLYIQGTNGDWYFAKSASAVGSAIRYQMRNWVHTNSAELHVTLSSHPFSVELAPGDYYFTAERGTESRGAGAVRNHRSRSTLNKRDSLCS